MTDPVQPTKLQASQGAPSSPSKWPQFKEASLGSRMESWHIWNRYEFKRGQDGFYRGREITQVDITRYVVRGGVHLLGPLSIFMDVGWQDAEVTYDRRKKSEGFKVEMDINTQSPSSLLAPGAQLMLVGKKDGALLENKFMEYMLQGSTSFILTHREIRPDNLTLDLGDGLKADLSEVSDQYIQRDNVTYQMMYAEMMLKMKFVSWEWFQPFGALGPNYMDTRLFVALKPKGESLLKTGGVKWSDVKRQLDFKKWGARYELGLTSDFLELGAMLYMLGQGFGFQPNTNGDSRFRVLGTYLWAYIPEDLPLLKEGRNRFRASSNTSAVELRYSF